MKIDALHKAVDLLRQPESKARYPEDEYPWEECRAQIMHLLQNLRPGQRSLARLLVLYGLRYDYSHAKSDDLTSFSAETFIEVFGKEPIIQELALELVCNRQYDQLKSHLLVSFYKRYNAKMPHAICEFLTWCITQRATVTQVKIILEAVATHLLTPLSRKLTVTQLDTHLAIIVAIHVRFPSMTLEYGSFMDKSISFHEFAEAFNYHFFLEPGYMLKFYKKHLSKEK